MIVVPPRDCSFYDISENYEDNKPLKHFLTIFRRRNVDRYILSKGLAFTKEELDEEEDIRLGLEKEHQQDRCREYVFKSRPLSSAHQLTFMKGDLVLGVVRLIPNPYLLRNRPRWRVSDSILNREPNHVNNHIHAVASRSVIVDGKTHVISGIIY